MEKVAAWLGGPRHRVILLSAALFLVPLFMPLAAALVAFATLLKGPREGVIAALAAALVVGGVSAIQSGAQGLALAMSAVLILGAVTYGAILVGRSGSLDFAFQAGTLVFGALAAVFSALPAGREIAAQVAPQLAQAFGGGGSPEAAEIGQMVAALLFGLALGGLLLSLFIALLLGRWLEGVVRPPPRAGLEFRGLKAGRLVTLVVSVVFIGAMFTQGGGGLGNAAIVFVLAMTLQGFAVTHWLAARHELNRGWLVLVYALVLLPTPLSPFAVMAMAATGYMDNWLGFRRPAGGPPAAGGD